MNLIFLGIGLTIQSRAGIGFRIRCSYAVASMRLKAEILDISTTGYTIRCRRDQWIMSPFPGVEYRSAARNGAPLTPERPVLKESQPSTWRRRGEIGYVATRRRWPVPDGPSQVPNYGSWSSVGCSPTAGSPVVTTSFLAGDGSGQIDARTGSEPQNHDALILVFRPREASCAANKGWASPSFPPEALVELVSFG